VVTDLTPDFWILPLPCGCATDASMFYICGPGIAECPWCGATFYELEFNAWLKVGAPPPIFLEHAAPAILRDGERLLEPRGRCSGCGVPLARERGSVKEFHLSMPFDTLLVLEN
jgi:hypothetical protein